MQGSDKMRYRLEGFEISRAILRLQAFYTLSKSLILLFFASGKLPDVISDRDIEKSSGIILFGNQQLGK